MAEGPVQPGAHCRQAPDVVLQARGLAAAAMFAAPCNALGVPQACAYKLWRRSMMALPRWRRSGGADFVFFHAHPGFEWDDVDVTTDLQSLLCNDFQWAAMVVVEQGQRWRCPTFTPRSTILAPYASTEVVSSLDSKVPDAERDVLAFFRCACGLRWDAAAWALPRAIADRPLALSLWLPQGQL